jgi:hypothetical protein
MICLLSSAILNLEKNVIKQLWACPHVRGTADEESETRHKQHHKMRKTERVTRFFFMTYADFGISLSRVLQRFPPDMCGGTSFIQPILLEMALF